MKQLLLLFFVCLSTFAWTQNYSIRLSSDVTNVSVNEAIKITVTTDIKGQITEKWPVTFQKTIGSSSSSKFVQDPRTKTLVQEHNVLFTGSFSKIGSYTVGPFVLHVKDKKFVSNSLTFQVGSSKNQSNSLNSGTTFGQLSASKSTIYEGEPFVLEANLFSNLPKGRILLSQDYLVSGDPDYFDLPVNNDWSETTKDGNRIWVYNFGNKLIYPLSVDNIGFKPFHLQYATQNGVKQVNSNTPSITVKRLPSPSPEFFYGAVGSFSVQQYTSTTNLRQGEVIPVEITLSGKGNFHQLQKPKLELPQGVVVYGETNVKELYDHSKEGSIGKVIYQFHLQILDAGKIELPNFRYAYFSPTEEKFIHITDSNTIRLNVMTNNEYQKDLGRKKEMLREGQIAPFTTIEPIKKTIVLIEKPWFWLLLILPPCLCFFFIINSIQHNSFLEQRFARFKRKPNIVKDLFHKINQANEPWDNEVFKQLDTLILFMLEEKQKNIEQEMRSRSERLKHLKEEENEEENAEKLEIIIEILNQNRYAYVNQSSLIGVVDELKHIALSWKQL